jgi:hypothetical protein
MLSALKKELAFYLKHPKFALQNRKVHSVYFGGGTPTLARVNFIFSLQLGLQVFLVNAEQKLQVSVINSVLAEIDKLTGGLPAELEVTIEVKKLKTRLRGVLACQSLNTFRARATPQ